LNWPFKDNTGKILRDTLIYRKYNPESNLARISSFRYFVEPGDNINITETDKIIRYGKQPGDYCHQLFFEGKGAAKYNLIQQLDNMERQFRLTNNHLDFSLETYSSIDSLALHQLGRLDFAKPELSAIAYTMIKGDIVAYYEGVKLGIFSNAMQDGDSSWLSGYTDKLMEMAMKAELINAEGIMYSSKFSAMILNKYNLDSCLIPNKMFNLFNCFQYIKSRYSGDLRDKLFTLLVTDDNNRDQSDLMLCINEALAIIKDTDLKSLVEAKKDELTASLYSYDFYLVNSRGESVKLKDYKNKVVIIDFWFTGCGACRELAPDMEKIEKEYSQGDVVFLSVNTDKVKGRWDDGLKSGAYSSAYAINLSTGNLAENHPLVKHLNVGGYPTVLLFDKSGKQIRFTNPQLDKCRDLASNIEKLRKLN
jgi:thiol-disulfide isomerase/thioredoxin